MLNTFSKQFVYLFPLASSAISFKTRVGVENIENHIQIHSSHASA